MKKSVLNIQRSRSNHVREHIDVEEQSEEYQGEASTDDEPIASVIIFRNFLI